MSEGAHIRAALRAARRFLGPDARAFRNEAGDLIVQSRDAMREVRFDFNDPSPHEDPHMHVIEYERVKNVKDEVVNRRIWPIDIQPK